MFSFNAPAGACPDCDGLGTKQYFEANLVIHDERDSLADGAIRGWDRKNIYYFHMLKSLADHYGFDIDAPWKSLSKKHRDAVLYGSGEERIDFSYANDRGDMVRRRHKFEGVIPNMERRYKDTDSQMVREHLSRYIAMRPCTTCDGLRLQIGRAHV